MSGREPSTVARGTTHGRTTYCGVSSAPHRPHIAASCCGAGGGLGYTRRVTLPDRSPGRFLTIEGPDGAGKTLQAKRLVDALTDRGYDALLTREPGGTRLGDQIREVLMATDGAPINEIADALLFNAARAQHVGTLIP